MRVPPTPAPCQPIADQIQALTNEKRRLQRELQGAAPGEKPGILFEIRALERSIAAARLELQRCIDEQPKPPLPPDPPPEDPRCATLRRRVAALTREVRRLQKELRTAPPGEKPGLVLQIRRLQARARTLRDQLRTLGCH